MTNTRTYKQITLVENGLLRARLGGVYLRGFGNFRVKREGDREVTEFHCPEGSSPDKRKGDRERERVRMEESLVGGPMTGYWDG